MLDSNQSSHNIKFLGGFSMAEEDDFMFSNFSDQMGNTFCAREHSKMHLFNGHSNVLKNISYPWSFANLIPSSVSYEV